MKSFATSRVGSKKTLGPLGRKRVDISDVELVATRPLREDGSLPLLIEPRLDGVDLVDWVGQNQARVQHDLLAHGGVLFRGFSLTSLAAFEDLARAASGELLEYTFRSTPRREVEGRIYTSTEYPADRSIPLHNEMSYTNNWPMKIWFYSVQVASTGGETPIADSHRVFERIDPELREKFSRKKVAYIRNYGEGIDLPWQEVFQTDDQSEVEAFCGANGIELEWQGEERLFTRQVCPAVSTHPRTGQELWFNQAHLFHVSSLGAAAREVLLETLSEEELPRNATFGDGTLFSDDELKHVRWAYDQETVAFPWQQGDLLLLDNMLVAHGRRPFTGERKVLVSMAEAAGR